MRDNEKIASIVKLLDSPIQVDADQLTAVLCDLGIITKEERATIVGIAIGMMLHGDIETIAGGLQDARSQNCAV